MSPLLVVRVDFLIMSPKLLCLYNIRGYLYSALSKPLKSCVCTCIMIVYMAVGAIGGVCFTHMITHAYK